MARRRLVLLTAGLLLAPAAGVVTAVPAAAVDPCDPEPLVIGSVDGDFTADVAVGLPERSGAAGAVDVRMTAAPNQVLTRPVLGLGAATAGDRFGASVALGDLDADGCADLAIGAPGEDGAGVVHLAFGSPAGVETAGALTVASPVAGGGQGFGSAVALTHRGTVHDLWVGVPGRTVSGAAAAGVVLRYVITPDGAGGVTVAAPQEFRQGAGGVPGTPEAGDRFGEVLGPRHYGVFIGTPSEDLGTRADAGSVTMLTIDVDSGLLQTPRAWTQDTAGVPGVAEAGDRFGAAVAGSSWALVGVPGEDVGSRADAGSVQEFVTDGSDVLRPGRGLTQNSPGMPGVAEAGDRFGAAVVVGTALLCQEDVDAAVGAPGEDVGSVRDAGSVTLFSLGTNGSACAARVIRQGSGLSGTPESGDKLGQTMALLPYRFDFDEDTFDRALVGAPGEDVDTAGDAGLVQPSSSNLNVNGTAHRSVTFSGGATANLRYGTVIATPAG